MESNPIAHFITDFLSSHSQSVNDYKPYSLAELPVSIFGNFYDNRREQRLRYLNDVREKVLKRAGSHLTNELTLEDVIHEEVIANITYANSNYKHFNFS